jgi:2-C-methyl-D-erythritol 2,4-cyclodiphosphate synthase
VVNAARFRVGQGFDVHALVPGRRLRLAGVELGGAPGLQGQGLLGHSDADVLTHALIDALLGAAALGDIGALFPDSDARHRDADSLELLAQAWQRVRGAGWGLGNIDCTLIAQQPKIAPYVEAMRARLAAVLGVRPDCISIKGKTSEWLGFTGRGEGIAALVVVALVGD